MFTYLLLLLLTRTTTTATFTTPTADYVCPCGCVCVMFVCGLITHSYSHSLTPTLSFIFTCPNLILLTNTTTSIELRLLINFIRNSLILIHLDSYRFCEFYLSCDATLVSSKFENRGQTRPLRSGGVWKKFPSLYCPVCPDYGYRALTRG
jgi:hypothetical protein